MMRHITKITGIIFATLLILNSVGIFSIIDNTKAAIPDPCPEETHIAGYVFDNDTGLGISNAIVTVYCTEGGCDPDYNKSTITNLNGFYNIDVIDGTTYVINVTANGYFNGSKTIISFLPDEDFKVNFNLEPDIPVNNPPVISNEVPLNNSNDIPIDLLTLAATIEDPNGDTFEWTIETSPDIGSSSDIDSSNCTATCTIQILEYSTTYTWYVNATDGQDSTKATHTFTTEDEPIGPVEVNCDKNPLVVSFDENISVTFSVITEGEPVDGKLRIDNLTNRGDYNQTWALTNFDGTNDESGQNTSLEVDVINGIAIVHNITANNLPAGKIEKNISFWFKSDNGEYARCIGRLPVQVPEVTPSPQYVPLGQTSMVTLIATGRGQNLEGILVGLDGCGLTFANNDGFTGPDGAAHFSITPSTTGNIDIHVIDEGRIVDTNIIVTSWALDINVDATVDEGDIFCVIVTDAVIGTPVEGAYVEMEGIATMMSDGNGQAMFEAPSVSSDTDYIITATKEGYLSDSSIIKVINLPPVVENSTIVCGFIDDEATNISIEGAHVSLCFFNEPGETRWYHADTNESGYYEMETPSGEFWISITADGYYDFYMSGYVAEENETLFINVTLGQLLPQNTIVCGYIYNNNTGIPIEDAYVRATWTDETNHSDYNFSHTNENGYYEINVTAGQIDILVMADYYFWGYSNGELNISENKTLWYNNSLTPYPVKNSIVCGYITNISSDLPIENVRMYVDWHDQNSGHTLGNVTFTDENGFYRMNIAAGDIFQFFSKNGYYDRDGGLLSIGENETLWINLSLIPIIEETAVVSGYVKDYITGLPIEAASIDLYWLDLPEYYLDNTTHSDIFGFYGFVIYTFEEDNIGIIANADGYQFNSEGPVAITENQTLTIDLDLMPKTYNENSKIKGYINESDSGVPIENANIVVYINVENEDCIVNITQSDSNGFYLMNVPAGDMQFSINSVGFIPIYNYNYIEENATMWFNFSLDKIPEQNSTICGFITDSLTGNPIENAEVAVASFNPYIGFDYYNITYSDFNGYYTINLYPGDYILFVSAEGYYSNEYSYNSVLENETISVNISLYPEPEQNSTLCGFILDDNTGEPIENADISVYWTDGLGHSDGNLTSTDSNGYYQINVADGDIVDIYIFAPEYLPDITGNYNFNISENTTIWQNFTLVYSKVIGLTVTDAKDGKLDLSWNPLAGNVTIIEYRIYRDGIYLSSTTETSYQDTGLTNGQSYTYQVSVIVENFYEGEKSDPVSGIPTASTTDSNPPPAQDESPSGPYIPVSQTPPIQDPDPVDEPDTIYTGIIPNNPPSKPIVDGVIKGHKNTSYNYTAVSTDPDGHNIYYVFDWGDGTTNTTDYLSSNESVTLSHKWTNPGIYEMSVEAYDDYDNSNGTPSGKTYLTISIDVLKVGNIGFIYDHDADGIYDTFQGEKCETVVEKILDAEAYYIDTNGDGNSDFIFEVKTGALSSIQQENSEEPQQNMMPFIIILLIIVILTVPIISILVYYSRKKNAI